MAQAANPSGVKGALLRAAAWTTANPRRAKRVQVVAAALMFQGAAFVLVAPKLVIQHPAFFWVGGGLLTVGVFLFLAPSIEHALGVRPGSERARGPAQPARLAVPTLADRIMARLTQHGRFDRLLALFGAGVVIFDLLFNAYLSSTPKLLSADFAVLGFGASLIAYPFLPRSLSRERNFLVLFFGALSLIFGVPLLLIRLGHDASGSVDEYTAALVTPQLDWLLNAFGVHVFSSSNDLWYPDLTTGGQSQVHIATQCSGLYSMAIFIAAFVALVLTDYPRLTGRVGALLAAGVALAYVANLLRMFVIIEAGHHYGGPALLWTHANLGDLIFLGWVAPFLWLSYRVLDPSAVDRAEVEHERFALALRAQGIDPSKVNDDDWFCASCYARVEAPRAEGPDACPSCGAALG
jgi:exosortase/archaeosortase family protein